MKPSPPTNKLNGTDRHAAAKTEPVFTPIAAAAGKTLDGVHKVASAGSVKAAEPAATKRDAAKPSAKPVS